MALSVPERLQNGYNVEEEVQVTADLFPLAARRTAARNGSEADAKLQKTDDENCRQILVTRKRAQMQRGKDGEERASHQETIGHLWEAGGRRRWPETTISAGGRRRRWRRRRRFRDRFEAFLGRRDSA
jgi:hypothetical protein